MLGRASRSASAALRRSAVAGGGTAERTRESAPPPRPGTDSFGMPRARSRPSSLRELK